MRHSLWEQDSLDPEAHNELLFGNLDGEVEALQQRKAVYDEGGGCQMGVTLAGATQAVTQIAWQNWRWAVNHLHWRVLW